MIKQTNLDAINITSDAVQRKKIDLTVMSYDKDVHRCTVPIDIDIETIDKVLVLYTFDYNESVIQTIADLSDGKIEFDLPNEIRGYSGPFNIELDINFKNNRQATVARYKAKAQKSDIDSVDLSDQKIYHFEMFDEMVREIETKKTESIFAINGNVDLVVTSKNNAIDNINQSSVDVDIIAQQKKNEINETTNQFNSHANEQKGNIDNATTALESDVETANNAIANINAKNTQVNTLASDFTADVATKQSDVTSKYNAFDASVTTANQTITDILALTDGVQQMGAELNKKANKAQEAWITPTLLNGWYAIRTLEPPQYMKDEFGFVHFRGAVSKGASATSNVAFQLPTGYRPNNSTTFSISEIKVSPISIALQISVIGNVDFAGAPLNSWYGISSITFKAV